MARTKTRRVAKVVDPDLIRQADPTPEQRAKSIYVVAEVQNPFEHTEPGTPARTNVCKRIPSWQIIASRGSYSAETVAILTWYADRYALASSGLTMDSCARLMGTGGGGNSLAPNEAAMNARSDCKLALKEIKSGVDEFMAVMHDDMTFEQIGDNSYQRARAAKLFKVAASWLLLKCGHRVMA